MSHEDLFKRVEEISLIEEEPFWMAKRCKQVNDVKLEIKNDSKNITISVDDTFELATRVQVQLDNRRHKVYKQVQSVLYRGKTLIHLRFTAAGSESLRKDTLVWIQKDVLERRIPKNENGTLDI